MARLQPRWQRKKLVGKRKPADPIEQGPKLVFFFVSRSRLLFFAPFLLLVLAEGV